MSREVVVVDGLRTPYSRAGTELKDVGAADARAHRRRGAAGPHRLRPRGPRPGHLRQHRAAARRGQRGARLGAARPASPTACRPSRSTGCAARACSRSSTPGTGSPPATRTPSSPAASSPCPTSRFLYSHESQEVFTEVFTARSLPARLKAASKFRPRHFKPLDRPPDGPDGRGLRPEHGRDGGGPRQGARHLARGAGRLRACGRTSA